MALTSFLFAQPAHGVSPFGSTPNRSSVLLCLTFALLLGRFTGLSQPQWQYVGLQNESIKSIAISPSDPNTIYAGSISNASAGTVGGLFKTTNGGATWDTLLRGFSTADIDIDPSQTNVVYLSAVFLGILKSYDAGEHWVWADSGIVINQEKGPVALAINPVHPEILYCGTTGFYGGTLYKSTTAGASWLPLHCDTLVPGPPYPACFLLLDGVTAIGIDPQRPDTLLAGIPNGHFLLKTSNGGTQWDTTGYLEWGVPFAIAFDPFDGQKIYAGRSNTGLHLTTDGGATWQKIMGGLPDTTALVSIATNKARRNELYAMTAFSGRKDIFRSSDGGFTWTYTNIPVNTARGEVAISPSGTAVFAGVQRGVYKMDIEVGVNVVDPRGSTDFSLDAVYPNPANGIVSTSYRILGGGVVSVRVYDILGREITTLVNEYRNPGEYRMPFNATDLSSGVYILRMTAGGKTATTKLLVVK